MKITGLLVSLFLFVNIQANDFARKGPSSEQVEQMALHNQLQSIGDFDTGSRNSSVIPFAEYNTTGYLFFSDSDYYGMAKNIKETLAKNLPTGVDLVVYTQSRNKSFMNNLFRTYEKHIDKSRIKILQVPRSGSNDFWTRDNLPLPVWNNGGFGLVDARYYYNFEPDVFLSNLFNANYDKHNYFFEGGNFVANSRGECIVVNRRKRYSGGTSDTAKIPDHIFKNKYGCQTLIRLKHLKGIGHSDEVVKFMTDDIIVTDEPTYISLLESYGFTVKLLPEPDRNYETYINSLQVNDTLYVPVFGERHDQKAIDAYKSLGLGLKIVTINSRQLATRGQGGIHCITMNYPDVPLEDISREVKGKIFTHVDFN